MLPFLKIFFLNVILIRKCQKWSFSRGTLVSATTIYQTKCTFIGESALFLLFRMLPCDFRLFPARVTQSSEYARICLNNSLMFFWICLDIPKYVWICLFLPECRAGLDNIHTLTLIGICMILDMCTLTGIVIFSIWFFKVFKIFLVLLILFCLKTYCYIFDL